MLISKANQSSGIGLQGSMQNAISETAAGSRQMQIKQVSLRVSTPTTLPGLNFNWTSGIIVAVDAEKVFNRKQRA